MSGFEHALAIVPLATGGASWTIVPDQCSVFYLTDRSGHQSSREHHVAHGSVFLLNQSSVAHWTVTLDPE